MPSELHVFANHGLQKTVSYQDVAYGEKYLNSLQKAVAIDSPDKAYAFANAAAKHLANAMCYNDVIQVADVKTNSRRADRIRSELNLDKSVVIKTTEYFHPRIEEFCGTLPRGIGQFIENRPRLSSSIDKIINRGQRIRTDSVFGFTVLWIIAGLRPIRRRLLRHSVENAHIQDWYGLALATAKSDYELAVELLNCRQLIKGYSDTHLRGQSKFQKVLSGLDLVKGRDDAADWIKRLQEAALKDEQTDALDGMIRTMETMCDPAPNQ